MDGVATAQDRRDQTDVIRPSGSGWIGVASIAAGTFVLVTTEFLPIGLLTPLAVDLHVSEGVTGLSVTGPGFIAAIAGPLLALLAGNLDRRIVVIALTLSIVLSNLIGAIAPNFALFLVGRLILGLAVGGLWTFAVAVSRRLVPESAGARATSIISAGIAAGTVFGMPVCAAFGAWPVCNQIWMFTSSPKLYEAGSALMVSAFQISLAAGATVGGLLVDSAGVGAAFLVGGVVAIAGAACALAYRGVRATAQYSKVTLGEAK